MAGEVTPREGEPATGVLPNYICEARLITLIAPYDVVPGDPFLVGMIFAIATRAAVAGAPVEGMLQGVFSLAKAIGEVWTQGAPLYWDPPSRSLTLASKPGDPFAGFAITNSPADAATGIVVVPIGGSTRTTGPAFT